MKMREPYKVNINLVAYANSGELDKQSRIQIQIYFVSHTFFMFI